MDEAVDEAAAPAAEVEVALVEAEATIEGEVHEDEGEVAQVVESEVMIIDLESLLILSLVIVL